MDEKTQLLDSLDDFTRSYLETALWSSTYELEEGTSFPMDENFDLSNLSLEVVKQAIEDCQAFQEANKTILSKYPIDNSGHDFWLTRNHHGASFWDGDYELKDGQELTKDSHAYGSVDLYVGDDGLIYG